MREYPNVKKSLPYAIPDGTEIVESSGSSEELMTSRNLIAPVAFMCCVLLCGFPGVVVAQDTARKCTPPQTDSSFIDAQGTAHVTRVVPVPDTLSPEAQKAVAVAMPDTDGPEDLAKRRAQASAWQVNGGEQMRKTYPVNIVEDKIAGVPVRIVTPLTIPPDKQNRVLINLHGGGFNADWGSTIETIPIANLTQTKVVAVLYSLSPEHPFPTALNESVAVYKELLKTYKPETHRYLRHIGWRNSYRRSGGRATASKACLCPPHSASFRAAETSAKSATRGLCMPSEVCPGGLSPPTGKPDTSYSRNHTSERSGIVADLRRPQRLPADALPHQRARPATQQYRQLPQGVCERRRQRAVGRL